MQFVVEIRISDSGRGQFDTTFSDAIAFLTQMAIPTVQALGDLKAQKKILAGGPHAGDIVLTYIAEADSAIELDKMFEPLALWPRLQTNITPLITISDWMDSLKQQLARIKDNPRSSPPKGSGMAR